MTVEEVKSLLKSVKSKKSRLLALQQYIAEERSLMSGVNAVDYAKTPVQGSGGNAQEERYIKHADRIARVEAVYDKLFEDMCAEEDELGRRMERLNPTEYEVILNRYMRGESVAKTAQLMGYERDSIYPIQRRAVRKMAKD